MRLQFRLSPLEELEPSPAMAEAFAALALAQPSAPAVQRAWAALEQALALPFRPQPMGTGRRLAVGSAAVVAPLLTVSAVGAAAGQDELAKPIMIVTGAVSSGVSAVSSFEPPPLVAPVSVPVPPGLEGLPPGSATARPLPVATREEARVEAPPAPEPVAAGVPAQESAARPENVDELPASAAPAPVAAAAGGDGSTKALPSAQACSPLDRHAPARAATGCTPAQDHAGEPANDEEMPESMRTYLDKVKRLQGRGEDRSAATATGNGSEHAASADQEEVPGDRQP